MITQSSSPGFVLASSLAVEAVHPHLANISMLLLTILIDVVEYLPIVSLLRGRL